MVFGESDGGLEYMYEWLRYRLDITGFRKPGRAVRSMYLDISLSEFRNQELDMSIEQTF